MSTVPSSVSLERIEHGLRVIVRPPRPSTKLTLQFLGSATGSFHIALEESEPKAAMFNWKSSAPDDVQRAPLGVPDEHGIRNVEVLASLHPVDEYVLCIMPDDSSSHVEELDFLSVDVRYEDGDRLALGLLPLAARG